MLRTGRFLTRNNALEAKLKQFGVVEKIKDEKMKKPEASESGPRNCIEEVKRPEE